MRSRLYYVLSTYLLHRYHVFRYYQLIHESISLAVLRSVCHIFHTCIIVASHRYHVVCFHPPPFNHYQPPLQEVYRNPPARNHRNLLWVTDYRSSTLFMATMAAAEPTIPMPPRELEAIEHIDNSLTFPTFTPQTAWTLGCALRTKLLAFAKPCVIDISLAHGNHCLFHATTHAGTTVDNDHWVTRKRNTVLRWGSSTWYMHNKFAGDEAAFAAKFALGEGAGSYAIHGGGWPVRVQSVAGIVAVVIVSGLKQEQDHGIIVQTVGEMLEEMGLEAGEKKKED